MTTAAILIFLFFAIVNTRMCYEAYREENYFATSISAIGAAFSAAFIIYLIAL